MKKKYFTEELMRVIKEKLKLLKVINENLLRKSSSCNYKKGWECYVVNCFKEYGVSYVPIVYKHNATFYVMDKDEIRKRVKKELKISDKDEKLDPASVEAINKRIEELEKNKKNYFKEIKKEELIAQKVIEDPNSPNIVYIVDKEEYINIVRPRKHLAKVVFNLSDLENKRFYFIPLTDFEKRPSFYESLKLKGGDIEASVEDFKIKVKIGEKSSKDKDSGDYDPQVFFDNNNKLFIPAFFGINRDEEGSFSNVDELKIKILDEIQNSAILQRSNYANIKRYLEFTINLVSEKSSEINFNTEINIKIESDPPFKIHPSDLRIISKNYGEIISGMFVFKNISEKYKSEKYKLAFPKASNETINDFFIFKEKDGVKEKFNFSVKSKNSISSSDLKGIKTSLTNEEEIKKILERNNITIPKKDLELFYNIFMMSSAQDESNFQTSSVEDNTQITNFRIRTTDLFRKLFSKYFPEKEKQFLDTINRYFNRNGLFLKSFRKEDLNEWFEKIKGEKEGMYAYTKDEFVKNFINIYKDVFSKTLRESGIKALEQNFKFSTALQNSKDHGYVMYYIGSFLKDEINKNENMIKILNTILNNIPLFYIVIIEMNNKNISIKIKESKGCKFKYGYNGQAINPNNRPIGFILDKKDL